MRRPQTAPEAPARPVPQRTCVGCRQAKSKAELIRFTLADGQVVANPGHRVDGRSAYLCPNPSCWTTGEKRRALDRALRVPVTADDWLRLRKGILVEGG